jgi:hypothetical protein
MKVTTSIKAGSNSVSLTQVAIAANVAYASGRQTQVAAAENVAVIIQGSFDGNHVK